MATKAKTLSKWSCGDHVATEMAERNLALLIGEGWKIKMGWDDRSPTVGRYADHCYMMSIPVHKYAYDREIYCCEPYGLDEETLLELIPLTETWNVTIGGVPLWYPGRTTPIRIESK